MSGSDGSHRAPNAPTRTSATNSPREVSTSHRAESSTQRAASTSHPKTCRSRTRYRLDTRVMYAWISGWVENDRLQPGFRAKEYE